MADIDIAIKTNMQNIVSLAQEKLNIETNIFNRMVTIKRSFHSTKYNVTKMKAMAITHCV